MINGVNTVDFTFSTEGGKSSISTDLPKARSELISVFKYAYKPESSIAAKTPTKSKTRDCTVMETESAGIERVHVQRLQTHAQLRNNRWNYQTFYSLGTAMDAVTDVKYKTPNHNTNNNNNNKINNNNNNNINNKNIENKSAFSKCNKEDQQQQQQQRRIPECAGTRLEDRTSANVSIKVNEPKRISSDKLLVNDKLTSSDTYGATTTAITTTSGGRSGAWPIYHRTEDQENAFRRIEDVHNYAKLNRYGHSNESSDGSTREYDDEEDDDDDEDEEERIALDDDYHGGVDDDPVMLHAKTVNNNKQSTSPKSIPETISKTPVTPLSTEDTDAIVDVETVTGENEQQLMQSPPAHHARRPMNAFLIFCKRHRAIVKDKYKSLENRAITKILGDWWASLDGDEKECFTKLAQQNKDAFFTAHPNFKWYKLPAPPLRTLSTRPSNSERTMDEHDHDHEGVVGMSPDEPQSPNKTQSGSYFKLADEAQMGELNSLMNMKNRNQIEPSMQCPLQQALGETTHFLSAHMPSTGDGDFAVALNDKLNCKRRAVTENSFSSNSSEDDILPKKSSRSCKGKIYQELVSSGQIAPVTKKTKATSKSLNASQFPGDFQDGMDYCTPMLRSPENLAAASYYRALEIRGNKAKRTVSESDISHHFNDQFGQFDLEEKIKQLPALSLDAYLQRKRCTKKKKKFTARKRNSNSVSLPITGPRPLVGLLPPVGSQKRKARKESITRRDLSAIENEVASLISLPQDGCYYFNETPSSTASDTAVRTTTESSLSPPPLSNVKSTEAGSLPPSTTYAASNDASKAQTNSGYEDSATPTSDLFILAELAAKRTEFTN